MSDVNASAGGPPSSEPPSRDPLWVRIIGKATSAAATVGGFIIMIMALTIAVDVVLRFGLNRGLPGTLELTEAVWMPIVALIGLGYAHFRNEQIRVSLAIEGASRRTQRVTLVIADLTAGLIGAWMIVITFGDFMHSVQVSEHSVAQPWVLAWPGRLMIVVALIGYVAATAARTFQVITGSAETLIENELELDRG